MLLLIDGTWKEARELRPDDRLRALYRYFEWNRDRPYVVISSTGNRCGYKWEHRFIDECVNGPIPEGYHIDHKDNKSLNNTINNLQRLTHSEHMKKTNTIDFDQRAFGNTPDQRKQRSENTTRWLNSLSGEEKQIWLESLRRGIKRRRHYRGEENPNFGNVAVTSRTNRRIWTTYTPEERAARGRAISEGKKRAFQRKQEQLNHKVESIVFVGYEDVYNMEVEEEETENFVANGVVIHNCKARIEALSVNLPTCPAAVSRAILAA